MFDFKRAFHHGASKDGFWESNAPFPLLKAKTKVLYNSVTMCSLHRSLINPIQCCLRCRWSMYDKTCLSWTSLVTTALQRPAWRTGRHRSSIKCLLISDIIIYKLKLYIIYTWRFNSFPIAGCRRHRRCSVGVAVHWLRSSNAQDVQLAFLKIKCGFISYKCFSFIFILYDILQMFILLCPSRLEGCSNASWYMVISLSTTCPAPSFSWCLRQREKPSKFRNVQNVQKRQRWELSISEALSWWTALHHRCVPVGRERASAGIGLLEKRLRECGFLRKTWQIPDACFAASSVRQPDD